MNLIKSKYSTKQVVKYRFITCEVLSKFLDRASLTWSYLIKSKDRTKIVNENELK